MALESRHQYLLWNHRIESFVFPDAATRAAGTGLTTPSGTAYTLVVADIGRVAFQSDTLAYYRLTGVGPLVWVQIGGGTGTVSSVSATVPAGFTVSGSPITTSGTIAITENTQNSNLVKAGPSSGGAATPTYRALVAADIPALPESAITNLVTDLAAKEVSANKGIASGYAGLDGSGKVPTSQLPASVIGGMRFQSLWNANTNSPSLPTGTDVKGDFYIVSTSGSTSLSGITDWKIGDWAVYDGTNWDKIDNTDAVSSVAGKTGTVTLVEGDITNLTTDLAARLLISNNLSDVASVSTSRTNLGLGTSATHATGDFAQTANNLSDLASVSTARTNLGLGTAATQASTAFISSTLMTTAGDIIYGGVSGAATRLAAGASNQFFKGGTTPSWVDVFVPITCVMNGGGVALTAGLEVEVVMPVAGTIVSATMLADVSGSAVVDVWKVAYASYPPTVTNTITASALPTISSAVKSQDSTLTGWTTSISAGDVLKFHLNSATTITRLSLQLKVKLS